MGDKVKVPTTLLEVLEDCTNEQIQGLLRTAKERTDGKVKITAPNKEQLIRNVRLGLESGMIREPEVISLIRDHEESGHQHVLFYEPNDKAARQRLNDGDSIAKSLVGKRLTDGSLPDYSLEVDAYKWSDFRVTKGGGQWTGKIYGHQQKAKFRNQEIKGNLVIRYYEKAEERIVCLAHWNTRELQIRISQSGAGGQVHQAESPQPEESSRQIGQIEKRLQTVWEMLEPAKLSGIVKPLSLWPCATNMLKAIVEEGVPRKKSQLPFHANSAQFVDSKSGIIEFRSQDDEEQILSATERKQSLDVLIASPTAYCRKAVIILDHHSASGMWGERPLRVRVGSANHANEVLITSRVNPVTMNYVADRIREYS